MDFTLSIYTVALHGFSVLFYSTDESWMLFWHLLLSLIVKFGNAAPLTAHPVIGIVSLERRRFVVKLQLNWISCITMIKSFKLLHYDCIFNRGARKWRKCARDISYFMTKGGRQRGQRIAGSITCIFTSSHRRPKKFSFQPAERELGFNQIIWQKTLLHSDLFIWGLLSAAHRENCGGFFFVSYFVNKHGTNFIQATVIIYLFICLFVPQPHSSPPEGRAQRSQLIIWQTYGLLRSARQSGANARNNDEVIIWREKLWGLFSITSRGSGIQTGSGVHIVYPSCYFLSPAFFPV